MVTSGTLRDMTNTLAYWHAVEMFDPQAIPKIPAADQVRQRRLGTKCVESVTVRPGQPVPALAWQPGHPRYAEQPERGTYGSVWRHTVYGGIFEFGTARETLAAKLGYIEGEDFGGRLKRGNSALFAFVVDERGHLLPRTTVFSSCAWATGRLHRPGPGVPGWLDGFEEVAADCEVLLAELLARPVSYRGERRRGEARTDGRKAIIEVLGPFAAGAITSLITAAAPVLGATAAAGLAASAGSLAERAAQRLTSGPPAPPNDGKPDDSPAYDGPPRLDGILLYDIMAFAVYAANLLALPPGLADHLRLRIESKPVFRKKDGSLPEPEPVFLSSMIAPDLKRAADAVARGDAGPALTSYLSSPFGAERRVDTLQDRSALLNGVRPDAFPSGRWPADSDRPLAVSQQFAVNSIVAGLGGTAGIFAVNGPPGTGKTTLLRDLIAAIVVERATRLAELQSPDDAFTGWHYWTGARGTRRRVRGLRPELTGHEILVASANNAAVENITKELPVTDAIGAEWRSDAEYFAAQAAAFFDAPGNVWGMVAAPLGNASKRADFREHWFWHKPDGMQYLLQELGKGTLPVASWRESVDGFNAALAAERAVAARRAAADRALRFSVHDDEVASARSAEDEARRAMELVVMRHEEAERTAGGLAADARWRRAVQHEHEASRPGGLAGLLGVGAAIRHWRERGSELAAEAGDAERSTRFASQDAATLASAARGLRAAAEQAATRAAEVARRQAEEQQVIKRARDDWDRFFPEDWSELDASAQELASPWSDPEWSRARTEVFLAALDLHRAFIEGAAKSVRHNLRGFFDMLKRDPDAELTPEAELAAWQTLFLVVPVISTTFASCGRMLAGLSGQSLGWVLVDEAGQAVPQHAAGAVWRAKRAVVVGDPLQLEPICQVPPQTQERLRVLYDADRRWLPSASSAQTLADEQNPAGTYVRVQSADGDERPRWVGAPLRVHRRCEQPMFDISNVIAYEGRMVYGTREASFPEEQHVYPPSAWIDVVADSTGKWVPAQGEALVAILGRLHTGYGVGLDRVYVLSPFRDVIAGCQSAVRSSRRFAGEAADDFIAEHIGTVHTMQGREADVVIFVLGTDPSPGKGARDWAASPVNLLNVAVSRARRRLFVIGSHAEWRDAPNFRELAARLRCCPWP